MAARFAPKGSASRRASRASTTATPVPSTRAHPAAAGAPCGASRTCDGSGACQGSAGCSAICAAAVGASCSGGFSDQQSCIDDVCPNATASICSASLGSLTSCAGAQPVISCGGELGYSISGCGSQQLANAACQGFGHEVPSARVCYPVSLAGCSLTGFDCMNVFETLPPGCQGAANALLACAGSSPTISCAGSLGFMVAGCQPEADRVSACQSFGPAGIGCSDICSVEVAAG